MKLTDLQINTINQLFSVLETLGSPQAQIQYKNAVPFVHIPEELFNQWDKYPRLAKEERVWFMEIFSAKQLKSILAFHREVVNFWRMNHNEPADVPEILQNELWIELGRKAIKLKEEFKSTGTGTLK